LSVSSKALRSSGVLAATSRTSTTPESAPL
jgi:hypothetical protein